MSNVKCCGKKIMWSKKNRMCQQGMVGWTLVRQGDFTVKRVSEQSLEGAGTSQEAVSIEEQAGEKEQKLGKGKEEAACFVEEEAGVK